MGVSHCRSCGCELQPWESDFCEGCGPFFQPAMKGKTMSSNEIRSAISRSETHSDIARVAVNCTVGNLRALLASNIECDWDMCEIEDNKVDVWGWSSDTPEGKQDWRLIVQCLPTID